MHKVLFYPYDYQSNLYVRFTEFLENVGQVFLMSFPGSGLIGKDASIVDKTPEYNLIIQSEKEWETVVEQVDTVYFLDSAFEVDIKKQIVPKIIDVLQKNKRAVCEMALSKEQMQKIQSYVTAQNGFECRLADDDSAAITGLEKITAKMEIYKFTTPIIMVMGTTERTNKRIVQLSLKRELEKEEFKVSCILSSGRGEQFGVHSYPDWMFEKGIGEVAKIAAFNRYVKEIEKKEAPDVIVIGIPGAIFPYNNCFTNYFGVQAFLAARAAEPDGVICCSNYIDFTAEFFKHIKNIISCTYSTEVLGFCLNNMVYDSRTTVKNGLKYTSIDIKQVAKVIKALEGDDIQLWNIMEDKDMKKMSKRVADQFSVSENVVLV